MTTTLPYPTLPSRLAEYIGPLHSVEYPPQGMASQVYILSSARGRFVLKVADTPPMVKALADEASILTALRDHAPFVAQPIEDAAGSEKHQTHAFLFTYVEGEPLHVVLKHTDANGCHHLIIQFALALRHVHSWEPDLPRSIDWLTDTLDWISTNVLVAPADTLVTGTNSRFDGTHARHLLADVQSWRSGISNDIVFSHYDYCLPNVLIRDNQVTGIIDWSGGGYIDRRFDLATALFSMRLTDTLQDSSYLTTFLQAYGYTESIDTLYFFEALHALTCAFW
jgi:aminoglycoside phosphotransferase